MTEIEANAWVCGILKGKPNSAFNVWHVWVAASMNVAKPSRFPLNSADQTTLSRR
jgi:hypothetical protein